jgi:hypothetical protein
MNGLTKFRKHDLGSRRAMSTPNKFSVQGRLEILEKTVGAVEQRVKSAHERIDAAATRVVVGPPGAQGQPGKDAVCICRNGRDSTVPGPPGRDGLQGRAGNDGRDGRNAPDLSTLRAEWRQDLAAIRTENAELKLMLTAMLESNSKSGQYLAFLRERTAKILKGKS